MIDITSFKISFIYLDYVATSIRPINIWKTVLKQAILRYKLQPDVSKTQTKILV